MLGCHFPSETTNLIVFAGFIGISCPVETTLKGKNFLPQSPKSFFKSSPMQESR